MLNIKVKSYKIQSFEVPHGFTTLRVINDDNGGESALRMYIDSSINSLGVEYTKDEFKRVLDLLNQMYEEM